MRDETKVMDLLEKLHVFRLIGIFYQRYYSVIDSPQ